MDDEIIHSWCFHNVECFDSTPSVVIIILDKDLENKFKQTSSRINLKNVSGIPLEKNL